MDERKARRGRVRWLIIPAVLAVVASQGAMADPPLPPPVDDLLLPSVSITAPANEHVLVEPKTDVTVAYKGALNLTGQALLPVTLLEVLVDDTLVAQYAPAAAEGSHTFSNVDLRPFARPGWIQISARAHHLVPLLFRTSTPIKVAVDPQLASLRQLQDDSERPPYMTLEHGLPRFVDMSVPIPAGVPNDPIAQALDFLSRHAAFYGLTNASGELYLIRTIEKTNETHVVFGQQQDGVPVYGAELAVTIRGGKIVQTQGGYLHGPQKPLQPPLIGAREAEQRALDGIVGSNLELTGEAALAVFNPSLLGWGSDQSSSAWRVAVQGDRGEGEGTSWIAFVDTRSGAVTAFDQSNDSVPHKRINVFTAQNGTTTDCFATGATPVLWFTEDGSTPGYPTGGDPDGAAAFTLAKSTYDLFHDDLDRHGWDNREPRHSYYAHYQFARPNAAYYPNCNHIRFSDGFMVKDIFAHESTHAVIRWTSNLEYQTDPGALNESYADVFGALSDGNWTHGEGRTTGATRDLANPPRFRQPDHVDPAISGDDRGKRTLPAGQAPDCDSASPTYNDCGFVHKNSGIPNKAAYLISQGGTFNGITIAGIGRPKLKRLYYDVMTSLTSTATFIQARDATWAKARDYFRDGSHHFTVGDVCDVIRAFSSVGLGATDADCNGAPDDATTDADGDGVADARDNCVNVPNPGQADANGDRIGDACAQDDDADGTPDINDNCPDVANTGQADRDNDGIGDACDDSDHDGHVDAADNCPDVANPGQEAHDTDGTGDACDADDDGDGIRDDGDNSGVPGDHPCRPGERTGCDDNAPTVPNPGQDDGDSDGVGDAVDNCLSVSNTDQVNTDGLNDGGDACDDDDDQDGVLDTGDNCRVVPNPYQFDLDHNNLGIDCDFREQQLFSPDAKGIASLIRFKDLKPARIPIAPCWADGCPGWIGSSFGDKVSLKIADKIGVRIVDQFGRSAGSAIPGGPGARDMKFHPDAAYSYKAPGAKAFSDRRYFLELKPMESILPTEDVSIDLSLAREDYPTLEGPSPRALTDDSELIAAGVHPITFEASEGRFTGEHVSGQYAAQGVTFVDDATMTPLIINDGQRAGTTHSPTQSLTSSADHPNTSSNRAMPIRFTQPVRRVGMYIGNGDGVLTATLTAYDANGGVVFSTSAVPGNDVLTFVGIDAGIAVIAEVRLDYGATLRSEEIDDLLFD
jgi:Zn-dependent metalloprotease